MKRLISLIILLIVTLSIAAQSNTVGRAIGKKVAKETSEQITKKVAKETAEEATEKIIRNVADDAASPVYKRAIRKGIANSSTKNSIAKHKNNYFKKHSNNVRNSNLKSNKNRINTKKNLTLAGKRKIKDAINELGADDVNYISKILNISPQSFKKVVNDEFEDMIEYHPEINPHRAVQYIKQRINEIRSQPNLAKEIFNDNDFIINEYTIAHLFPRHGQEFAFMSFKDLVSEMKFIYKNPKTKFKEDKNNITYEFNNKVLVFRKANPKQYVISFFTRTKK